MKNRERASYCRPRSIGSLSKLKLPAKINLRSFLLQDKLDSPRQDKQIMKLATNHKGGPQDEPANKMAHSC